MYKYSKGYFMKRVDIHDYPTRHVNNFNLTNNRKSFSDHAIRTNGLILLNSLSKTIRESESVKQYRNQFKQNLIKHLSNFEIVRRSCPVLSQVLSCVCRGQIFFFFALLYVFLFCSFYN